MILFNKYEELTKYIKSYVSAHIMQENALFSGKIYAAGKKFTHSLVMALTTNFNSANKMIATRNITNKIITTVDMIYKKTTRSTRAKRPPHKRSPCSRPGTQISCVVAPLTRLRWWFFLQLLKPGAKSSDHPNSFWRFHQNIAKTEFWQWEQD